MENKTENKTELDIVSYLANPLVRNNCRQLVSKMIIHSKIAKELAHYYCFTIPSEYVPEEGAIEAFLRQKHYLDGEIAVAKVKLSLYGRVVPDGVRSLVEGFFSYYRKSKVRLLQGQFDNDRVEDEDGAMEKLLTELSEVHEVKPGIVDMIKLGEHDAQTLLENELNIASLMPSVYDFVNESLQFRAYVKGLLVQWNAKPGVGKTLGMLNEAVFQTSINKKKVIWVAMGDMMKIDFVIRITSILLDEEINEVTKDLAKYYTPEIRKYIDEYWRFVILPPGEIDSATLANGLIALQTSGAWEFDIFFIDYDQGFKHEGESMYEEGGEDYIQMLRVCRLRGKPSLGHIASQIKINYYNTEVLPEDCSAESSRKQNAIDMMINIGPNDKNPKCGTFNVAKQRRGELLLARWKKTMSGRFVQLNAGDYSSMKATRQGE